MGNPVKEVELGAPMKDAKPPGGEAAEVPLFTELHYNTNGVENNGEDLKHESEKTTASSPKLGDDGGDDQAPLLAQEFGSDGAANGGAPSASYSPETLKEMEAKYAAYVRHDTYGNWGTREVSLWEKLQLLVALLTLCPLRIFMLFAMLVLFYVICKVCTLRVAVSSSDEGQESFAHMTGIRRTIIVRSGRFLARAMLFTFGFYYIPVSERPPQSLESKEGDDEKRVESGGPGAIVSNHVSYLDILYHMSASFPSFVAKISRCYVSALFRLMNRFYASQLSRSVGGACVDGKRSVAKLPLVGLISKCLGCVYVQREYKSSDHKGVSGVVTERLQAAHSDPKAPGLLLFPEGTTTNGGHILPFKTGAFLARTPVQPVILKYPYHRFSPAWDTISGARHVILLLCQFVNHLEVLRLPVYRPTEKECADPKLYANNVRTLMAAEGNLTMSAIGLYEKRIFHNALLGKPPPVARAPEGSESK